MTEKFELYECEVCGNLVEIIKTGNGELYCCGKPMQLLTAHTEDEMKGEYHLPVHAKDEFGNEYIQVGRELHPMSEEHHIDFIQMISQDGMTAQIKFLKIGETPKIPTIQKYGDYIAREHCNIHGLWANLITRDKG